MKGIKGIIKIMGTGVCFVLGTIGVLGFIIGLACALAVIAAAAIVAALGFGILFAGGWGFIGAGVIGLYILAFLLDIHGKWWDAKEKITQASRWVRGLTGQNLKKGRRA